MSRWAVLRPTPGSLLNSSIRRATGAIRPLTERSSTHARQAGQAEPSGHGRHPLPLELLAASDRVVHRGQDEVLQHLDLRGIDRSGVDLDQAAAKLNIDTGRLRLCCVPELPDDDQLASLTSAYDLFIAASQATFIPARARYNWMLVFFPYPIELSASARFRRRVGLWLRRWLMVPVYADGFYGAERAGDELVRWTNGHAALKIPLSSGRIPVRLLIAAPAATRLAVRLNGRAIHTVDLPPDGSRVPIEIAAQADRTGAATIDLISDTHIQPIGPRDARSVGVALRGIEIEVFRLCALENGAGEIGAGGVGVREIGVGEIGARRMGEAQIGAHQIGLSEGRAFQKQRQLRHGDARGRRLLRESKKRPKSSTLEAPIHKIQPKFITD